MTKRFPFAVSAFIGAVALLALAVKQILAVPAVQINLGPSGRLPFNDTVPFANLDGASLSGQSVSLDFTFANSEFVRLFTVTTSYEVSVELQTNGSGLVGFLHGTGYLTGKNGNALQSPLDLGSASGSDGSMVAALFPLLQDLNGIRPRDLSRPLDHYGVNFELTLPVNPKIQITGAELQLSTNGAGGPFGIGPGVPTNIIPDSGSTGTLLALSVAGIIGVRILRHPFGCRKAAFPRRKRMPA